MADSHTVGRVGRWWSIGAVGLVLVAGGCAGTEPVTDPEIPVFSTQQPAGNAGSRTVPKTCGEVATTDEISTILTTLVSGPVTPVVGVPQENIGRTARLDCYYGGPAASAPLWIGLASYTDEHSAKRRMSATVTDERTAGATVSEVPVGGGRGVLLSGARRMVVAQRDRTTVVVSVVPTLVRADFAGDFLGQLADLALSPREPD